MTNPAPGTLAWFEIATSDPDGAEKFYGSLFDWTFDADGPATSGGMDYRNITASGADQPMGGVFGTAGQQPDHAVFYIVVADVEATCRDAEQLGGSVVGQNLDPGPGAPASPTCATPPATGSVSSAHRRPDGPSCRRRRSHPRRRAHR
jgi:predicted enzyme related to lactoylglutathione lyase